MYKQVSKTLAAGGVAVIPTDTLYGIVGQALNRDSVERIYKIKGRQPQKPFIILISNISQLAQFDVQPVDQLGDYWPGPVSIILPCQRADLEYLHRGTGSLAFRLPAKADLRELIDITGPLVAPSANPEGQPPAETVEQAKNYFGDQIDTYLDGGNITGQPSRLIKIQDGQVETLR